MSGRSRRLLLISDIDYTFLAVRLHSLCMPQIDLEERTLTELEALREAEQSYDELIVELMNIYEASETTLHHSGD